jgi:hypothetical protein
MKIIVVFFLFFINIYAQSITLHSVVNQKLQYIDKNKEILLINKDKEISTLLERSVKNRFLKQKLIFILKINNNQYATENILIKNNKDYGIKFEKNLKFNIKKSYKISKKRKINKKEIDKIFKNLNKINYIQFGKKINEILILDLNKNFDLNLIKNKTNFIIIPFVLNDFDNKYEYKNLNLFKIKNKKNLNYDFLNKKNINLNLKNMLIQNNYEISNIYFFEKNTFFKKNININ